MKRALILLGTFFSLIFPLLFAQPATAADNPRVALETNHGRIVLELFPAKAPKTVAAFLALVDDKEYDGTIFHRVIDGFMIQGGGFDKWMQMRKTRGTLPNEANNGLKNIAGSIAMARTSDPNSASRQFFINAVDNDFLDFREETASGWGYTVFGQVVEGFEVVTQRIAKEPTIPWQMHQNVPKSPVIIERARRLK